MVDRDGQVADAEKPSAADKTGEVSTGALLSVEYEVEGEEQRVRWRLVVEPRPALDPLARAVEKLVRAEGG